MTTRDAASQAGSQWNVQQTVKDSVSKAANIFENAVSPGSAWSPDKMLDLSGKTYLVTGGNSGIGFQAAMQLAKKNATVTIASRNEVSGQRSASVQLIALSAQEILQATATLFGCRAVKEILRSAPGSRVHFSHVDLESFA